MFFFSRFSMHTDIPQKNLCVGCAHSLSIQCRVSKSWKEREGIAVSLSLSSSSSMWPCNSSLSRNDDCLYLRYHRPRLARLPVCKMGREQMAQWYMCVRVVIMDNKSLAAILWRSLLSLSCFSAHKYIHTSIITYRTVRFRWHRILVMLVLGLL
jgi:hypothetical protein